MPINNKYAALLLLSLLVGCGAEVPSEAEAEPAVASVTVAPAVAADNLLSAEYPGRVHARQVAQVRARVSGIVLKRSFTEGALVRRGDPLFQIDPAPFKAVLERAQAERARTEAVLEEAQASFNRYQRLVSSKAVSEQDFERIKGAFATAKAAHLIALAEVKSAQLNYDYTHVRAPIAGHIGRALVTEGALVGQDEATQLALVQNIQTVYVDFKVPAHEVSRLREEAASLAELAVHIDIAKRALPIIGQLQFADISVEPDTDQVLLRAQFDNSSGILLPGMYVTARLPLVQSNTGVKVPQRTLKIDAHGSQSVWVLEQEQVRLRPVVAGGMHGSDWLISQGLSEGEQVILAGNVKPGDRAKAQ